MMLAKDFASSMTLLLAVVLPLTQGGCGSSSGDEGPTSALGGAFAGGAAGTGGVAGASGTAVGTTAPPGDVAEKGLCTIDMQCPAPLVENDDTTCTFSVKDSLGAVAFADHAAVHVRGRSSAGFPKKNYAVELRSATGLDSPANLLGMGQDADYILDGAWADRSFMRNRLTFGLFRDAGPTNFAPQARYCELIHNGTSDGIYVLLERIKRDDDRVVLPEDDGNLSTFILKQDDEGTLRLSIGAGSDWQLVYPKDSVATPTQQQNAQAWLDQLGSALRSSDPNALLTMVDPPRIVDWIIIEEFAKNIDAYNLSLHFVRSAGERAWVVPWDTDLAYGQPTLEGASNELASGWVNTRTSLISKLSAIPEVSAALAPRYRELRAGILSNAAVTARLDSYAAILTADALERNFARWPISEVDFVQIYDPYSFYKVTSYSEEMTHFRTFIADRLSWMDQNIDAYPKR